MLERARNDPKIRWWTNAVIEEVLGQRSVAGVRLRDSHTGEESTLDDDGNLLIHSPRTRTAIAGVFAAGDLVDRTYRQGITAAGFGLFGRDRMPSADWPSIRRASNWSEAAADRGCQLE
jgi:thioredoxin reductase (NADPH)